MNSGNVGIGTTAPADPLTFGVAPTASGTDALINLTNNLSGLSASGTYIAANPSSAGADFLTYETSGVGRFGVNKNGSLTVTPVNNGTAASLTSTDSTTLVVNNFPQQTGSTGYAETIQVTDQTSSTGGFTGIFENTGALSASTGAKLLMDLRSNSSSKFAVQATGNVGIGTTSPVSSLDLSQKTDALALPSGTTAQEPGSPVNGMIRYNTTVPQLEAYINGAWTPIPTNPGSGCTGPSAFSFTNVTNQSLSTVVTSNTVTPTGCTTLNLSVVISGSGSPQVSINGGAWATGGVWSPGSTIAVRQTTSGSVNTAANAVVQVGSTSTTWTATTTAGQTQIFVTANSYNGNLGGLTGADSYCQSAASLLGYSGTWKAILSTSTTNANARLTILYPVVRASDGTTVAATNLWNTLNNAPSVTAASVSTGTALNGTVISAETCNDWTDGTSSYNGSSGSASLATSSWLANSNSACTTLQHLYCVSQ